MAFTHELYGSALASILNSMQLLRDDQSALLQRNGKHTDAPLCAPFAKVQQGTLAEADLLTLHFYQHPYAMNDALMHNEHGLALAMNWIRDENNELVPALGIREVRQMLYDRATATIAAQLQ
jgi:hypothetical protein